MMESERPPEVLTNDDIDDLLSGVDVNGVDNGVWGLPEDEDDTSQDDMRLLLDLIAIQGPSVKPTVAAKPVAVAVKPAAPVIAKPAAPVMKPAAVIVKPAAVIAKPAAPVVKPAAVIAKPAAVVAKRAVIATKKKSDAGPNKEPCCVKEDYVYIARLRRLPYTDAALWKRSSNDLAKELTPTPAEYEAVVARQEARRGFEAGHPKMTIAILKEQVRLAGGACSTGITRGGLIDSLLLGEGIPVRIELDADQAAVIARHADARIIIYAGPGAGKTTTLCHLVKKMCDADPSARVLALAYNRAAEETLSSRLRKLGVKKISKTRLEDLGTAGAAILTFDKLAHQINAGGGGEPNYDDMVYENEGENEGENENENEDEHDSEHGNANEPARKDANDPAAAEPKSQDTYRAAFDSALNKLKKQGGFSHWDVLIVDEAQDILPHHAAMIEGLCAARRAPRLVVAGDPRQELYPGARWFSDLWAATPQADRALLRYNHRSAPEIVAALNAFSKANFPTLHEDQLAARTEKGEVAVHIVDAPNGWPRSQAAATESARTVGSIVGAELAGGKPGDGYAISPVTVDKFRLVAATNVARQLVAEQQPGSLVHVLSGVSDAAHQGSVHIIANSRKIKGTERTRVVVYGADLDYSIVVSRESLIKMAFVALSRARDRLAIVMRNRCSCLLAAALKPVLDITGGAPATLIAPLRERLQDDRPPYIHVTGDSALVGQSGLCTSDAIPARVAAAPLEMPKLCLGEARADADFLGVYAEALAAQAMGANLARSVTVIAEPDRSQHGFCRVGTDFAVRVAPGAVDSIKKVVDEISTARFGCAPYLHAVLKYSVLIGRAWTVSARLLERVEDSLGEASRIAAWIFSEVGVRAPEVKYLVRGEHDLRCVRAPAGTPSPGTINYEVDMVVGGTPVELKYCGETTAAHRRQAAIYACLLGAEKTLLVNMRLGVAEWIAAADRRTVENVARAAIVLRDARARAIGPLAPRVVAPPSGVVTRCIISVDTESNEQGDILELSAVAFDADEWAVLGVFDSRAAGVTERERPSHIRRSGALDISSLTGLEWKRGFARDDRLVGRFRDWFCNLSARRVFIHWGGSERNLVGPEETVIDVLHCVFRPWLAVGGAPRQGMTTLGDAVTQTAPRFNFMMHRAFEDAVATMAVFTATLNFGGRL